MDAPAHMIARGRTLDSYGVEKFVGPGFVLDCRGRQEIPLALLRAHEEDIRRAEFLLFCTGWDRLWGKDGYYENFPSRASARTRSPSTRVTVPIFPTTWRCWARILSTRKT